jgi:hypothetical protein
VRRRDDANDALRSGSDHVEVFGEMVLAQGLGDEDCQASWDEEGDRGDPGLLIRSPTADYMSLHLSWSYSYTWELTPRALTIATTVGQNR